ncbi:hypothetical protein [Cutibacterium namnetense]|nr:hypothetical protein [Cutibacterium namnetense]
MFSFVDHPPESVASGLPVLLPAIPAAQEAGGLWGKTVSGVGV